MRCLTLLIIFVFNSSLIFSQEFQKNEQKNRWNESFTENLKKINFINKPLSNGLLSTIKFGLKIKNYKKDIDVNELMTIGQQDITIGSTNFIFETASKIYDPSFPTFVGHFGFSGDVTQGNAKYFIINFHQQFPNYNLLLIQTMASAKFAAANCYYNMGGIDEAQSIVKLVRNFIEANDLKREINIIGGSSSSAGMFHAASYFNRATDIQAKGLFLQSGFNHMGAVVDILKILDLKNKERKQQNLRKIKGQEKLLSMALLNKRIKAFEESIECQNKLGINLDNRKASYYQMVRESFKLNKKNLEQVYNTFYPGQTKTTFSSMENYYQSLALDKHEKHINFKMFWLHSENDPMSDYSNVSEGYKQLKKNEQFASLTLKKGGHSAYKEVYGDDFVNSLIQNFLESHPLGL